MRVVAHTVINIKLGDHLRPIRLLYNFNLSEAEIIGGLRK
jgi:hypothetical protein